jgi:hypothetical protein
VSGTPATNLQHTPPAGHQVNSGVSSTPIDHEEVQRS